MILSLYVVVNATSSVHGRDPVAKRCTVRTCPACLGLLHACERDAPLPSDRNAFEHICDTRHVLYHFELQMAGVILLGAMLACGIFLYVKRRQNGLQEDAKEREAHDRMLSGDAYAADSTATAADPGHAGRKDHGVDKIHDGAGSTPGNDGGSVRGDGTDRTRSTGSVTKRADDGVL